MSKKWETVSRVFHTLEGELETWKTWPLAAHYVYAFADGTYFTVIYDGAGQKIPMLAVIGIAEGETVETTSLGAGNAGSDIDLVTNRRIAEFKFIYWQGGSESVRKKTFFQDYLKLIRDQSHRTEYFYLLNTDIPLRFLKGKGGTLRMLDRNQRLASDFQQLYGTAYPTVGKYYTAHKGQVEFVNLLEVAPGLRQFVGFPGTEDEAALLTL